MKYVFHLLTTIIAININIAYKSTKEISYDNNIIFNKIQDILSESINNKQLIMEKITNLESDLHPEIYKVIANTSDFQEKIHLLNKLKFLLQHKTMKEIANEIELLDFSINALKSFIPNPLPKIIEINLLLPNKDENLILLKIKSLEEQLPIEIYEIINKPAILSEKLKILNNLEFLLKKGLTISNICMYMQILDKNNLLNLNQDELKAMIDKKELLLNPTQEQITNMIKKNVK